MADVRGAAAVHAESPLSADAALLMEELSATLARITGDSGQSSFDAQDVTGDGACFAIARDAQGAALGCGALRPLQEGVAEIKRMYARPGTRGVGSAVLAFLEQEARRLGYRAVWLSTRRVNGAAVAFYHKRGYQVIAGYGKYLGNPVSVCFAKRLDRYAAL